MSTTIIIHDAADQLVTAIERLVAEHSTGEVHTITPEVSDERRAYGVECASTVVEDPEPSVAPVLQPHEAAAPFHDVPRRAWLGDEIDLLLRYLELDGSHAQAETIRRARTGGTGMVSREEIQSLPGRTSEGMHGFVKPIKRVTKQLVQLGLLHERDRDDLLSAVYIQGTAIGYRVTSNIMDNPDPEDASAA